MLSERVRGPILWLPLAFPEPFIGQARFRSPTVDHWLDVLQFELFDYFLKVYHCFCVPTLPALARWVSERVSTFFKYLRGGSFEYAQVHTSILGFDTSFLIDL